MKVGVATADITPTDLSRTFVAGFGMSKRATGVLEPLQATALYVSEGSIELVFVSLDLVGFLRSLLEDVRSRVRQISDTATIICAATHTHAGPDTIGYWGPSFFKVFPRSDGKDPAYMRFLAESVADTIDRAKETATDAVLRTASFDVPQHWTRNDRKGGGRYDRATTIAFDAIDTSATPHRRGGTIATFLNFASHPETLWEHNALISPDYPGAFRRRVHELGGGVGVFFNGPLGAMLTPNVDADADFATRRAYAETLGKTLAELATSALEGVPAREAATVLHRAAYPKLTNTNWRFRLMQRLGLVDRPHDKSSTVSEVHWFKIGDVEGLTAPGELSPEVGHQVSRLLTSRHRVLIGLCGEELGYILTADQFTQNEYAYEQTMSLGPATAESLLNAYARIIAEPRLL